MTAVLPGNENGGRLITGNYLEITIAMEITSRNYLEIISLFFAAALKPDGDNVRSLSGAM